MTIDTVEHVPVLIAGDELIGDGARHDESSLA
jgi:hypothetical protein